MKYVEQLVLGYKEGESYIKNVYQFYSKHTKKKQRWKVRNINGLLIRCDMVMPTLKQCKKDRFIRVCQKKEYKVL